MLTSDKIPGLYHEYQLFESGICDNERVDVSTMRQCKKYFKFLLTLLPNTINHFICQ